MNPLADELLALSWTLIDLNGNQATLRRAVSTAYYALFHLLIADATLNWGRPEHRPQLGRLFDHGNMRRASEKVCSDFNRTVKNKKSTPSALASNLNGVADGFIRAQHGRIEADYVTSREWTHDEALRMIQLVKDTTATWHSIREQPEAQAYLVNMFGNARL